MSLTRPLSWLAAAVAVISLAAAAHAQERDANFATNEHDVPSTAPQFHLAANPFIELDSFDPDLQFFAPAEVGSFGGGEPPNTGFYITYDRMYINVTRPDGDDTFESNDGDFTWGNRFDAGFMSCDCVGWGMSAWHVDGPNDTNGVSQERLGRFNEDDDPPGSGDVPILRDRNPRIYDVVDSLNVARVSSFELNRIWRRKQFHNGAVLEPFLGVRYMTFKDFGRADNYHRFDSDAVGDPDLGSPQFEGPWEIYTTRRNVFENSMLGGQLGVRLHKQSGHWLLSGEFRAIAMQNWQFLTQHVDTTSTRVDDFASGGVPEIEIRDRKSTTSDFNEFVWGGEVRGEAAYELTRDISLRFGFFLMDLGQGIGRSNVIRPFPFSDTTLITKNDQDVFMGGVTFGVTVNR
jgi:hypothetical protein